MDVDDIRFKLAASRRILANNGCESRVAGHVSARAEGEDAFFVTPFEYFDETLPDRIVKVSFDLQVLEGEWEPSPAVRFHAGARLPPRIASRSRTAASRRAVHGIDATSTRKPTGPSGRPPGLSDRARAQRDDGRSRLSGAPARLAPRSIRGRRH